MPPGTTIRQALLFGGRSGQLNCGNLLVVSGATAALRALGTQGPARALRSGGFRDSLSPDTCVGAAQWIEGGLSLRESIQ